MNGKYNNRYRRSDRIDLNLKKWSVLDSIGVANHTTTTALSRQCSKPTELKSGVYWIRTNDPCPVKAVL